MPVELGRELAGILAQDLKENQLAQIVQVAVGLDQGRFVGMVVVRRKDGLIEIGGPTSWDLSGRWPPYELPRVKILQNGDTLTVTGNECRRT